MRPEVKDNKDDKSADTKPTEAEKVEVEGPGEIVATDNGDPTNMVPFPSHEREVFNGLALVIIRSRPDESGEITVTAKSPGLTEALVVVESQ